MPEATSLPPSLPFREKNCREKNRREKNCRENLPTLSAEELHEMCFEAHRLGNRAGRRYLFALLALQRTGLYSKLGCSSIAQYAEREYRYQHSQTYEDLKVAEALEKLPQSAETPIMKK